jgi:membrane-bound inhibitor of C-type lysozyme
MKNKIILVLMLIIVVGILEALYVLHDKSLLPKLGELQNKQVIATVTYSCSGDKFIRAQYLEGDPAMPVSADKTPKPTGKVEVSLNGEASTTLGQTISADGARYANFDESFVFWSKGDTALIMHNNSMDQTYTNCVARQINK